MTSRGDSNGLFPLARRLVHQAIDACRIPVSTYRLQLTPSFGFRSAAAAVPYLHALGVTDCYVSPILKARPGSTHGYDVCDPTMLNPDLGTEADFAALCRALRERGMGLIVDVVPNHMGVGHPSNAWWTDVLENGQASAYAGFFDIDWRPVTPELEGKVLLAVLEDQYGRELERGKFRLVFEGGALWLRYNQLTFPVAPKAYLPVLRAGLERLTEALDRDNEHLQEYQSIITALEHLPSRDEADPNRLEERRREKEVTKRRLAALLAASPPAQAAVQDALTLFNGDPDHPESFALLNSLIDAQPYRLAFWRVSSEEINYRRFFDVDDLAALQAHRPEVFAATHGYLLRLLGEGMITGLRVDHADGLRDPAAYFWRLQVHYLLARWRAQLAPEPLPEGAELAVEQALREVRRQRANGRWPLYVVAEKILGLRERLRADWAIYGTTGYDFLASVNALFVHSRSRQAFAQLAARLAPEQPSFDDLANASKKVVMLTSMASEVNALSHRLERLAKRSRHFRDFTLNTITFALREVLAGLNVYRTYIRPDQPPSAHDLHWVAEAVAEAKRRNPRTAGELFDFVGDTLTFRNANEFDPLDQEELADFVLRFQQFSGSVMAKGVEDTAFYRYHHLVSLNEVGGHPEHFGLPPAAFHQANLRRVRSWPHAMLATATHDTKRGEDVRPRISLLSETPAEWRALVLACTRLNRRHKRRLDGRLAPDGADEYLLYQTLIGVLPPGGPATPEAWAALQQRVSGYMLKATREAKVHTSWVNQNLAYEQALEGFVEAVLATPAENPFLERFLPFQRRIARAAVTTTLTQQVLRLTSPGVPDTYQGTERWDDSLVDPDNRRPVDFQGHAALLARCRAGEGHVPSPKDADPAECKLALTHALLQLRARRRALFQAGGYLPLRVAGRHRTSVVAYARRAGDEWLLVAVPRLLLAAGVASLEAPFDHAWFDTAVALPPGAPGRWRDALAGRTLDADGLLPAQHLFDRLPVAVLLAGS